MKMNGQIIHILVLAKKPHTLNKKKRIPNEEDIERIIGG